MVTDPIADMLTRIKNAYLAYHRTVEIPYSKMKEEMGKILVKEGYLKKCQISNDKLQMRDSSGMKKIVCELGYKDEKPVFENFERVSKPGRRVYTRWNRIPRTLFGYGITVISTPRGIMTDKEARKKKLGGEIICKVW